MKGITRIIKTSWNGQSPARANRRTGEVFINLNIWDTLDESERFFILLHEQGHIVEDTSDEFSADRYAFNEFVKAGYPLSESIYALTRVLSFDNPEHRQRARVQLMRSAEYDYYFNGHEPAKRILNI